MIITSRIRYKVNAACSHFANNTLINGCPLRHTSATLHINHFCHLETAWVATHFTHLSPRLWLWIGADSFFMARRAVQSPSTPASWSVQKSVQKSFIHLVCSWPGQGGKLQLSLLVSSNPVENPSRKRHPPSFEFSGGGLSQDRSQVPATVSPHEILLHSEFTHSDHPGTEIWCMLLVRILWPMW